MSAPNFHKIEAPEYLVLNLPENDEFLIKHIIDDIKYQVQQALEKHYSYYDGGDDDYELRSYPGETFGHIYSSKTYAGFTVEVFVNLIIRNGYYTGCNFDTCTQVYIEGRSIGNTVDPFKVKETFTDLWEEKPGMAGIVGGKAYLWIIDTIDNMKFEVYKTFRELSTRYVRTALFSNGEAIYERADNPRAVLKSAVN